MRAPLVEQDEKLIILLMDLCQERFCVRAPKFCGAWPPCWCAPIRRGETDVTRIEGGSPKGPGLVFRAVMTRLAEDEFLQSGVVGDGGIATG